MAERRLSHKDFDLFSTCLQEIYGCLDTEQLLRVGLDVLGRLVPCDMVAFNDVHASGEGYRVISRGQKEKEVLQRFSILAAHIHEHPVFIHHVEQDPDGVTPLKISDFLLLREFQKRTLCQEFFRPLEIRYQIAFWPATGNLSLHRWHRDFSERDRTLLEHFNRHFIQAWKNAVTFGDLLKRTGSTPDSSEPSSVKALLTRREREILQWIGEGKSNPVIAKILGVSDRTVEKHVEHILEKLGVENRHEAMREALRWPPSQ